MRTGGFGRDPQVSVQPAGRRGSAQASMTSWAAVSTRISNLRTDRCKERETFSPSSGRIPLPSLRSTMSPPG